MSFAVLYMGKYIGCVSAEKASVFFAVVREFEEKFGIFVGSLEERRAVEIPLGQEGGGLSRVAGLGTGLDPAAFFHIRGEILVHGHIFFGQEIVVLVVGVEVLHNFGIERNFEDPFIPLYFDIAVICGCIYRRGKSPAEPEEDEQFLSAGAVMIRIVIGLRFSDAEFAAVKISVDHEGQKR